MLPSFLIKNLAPEITSNWLFDQFPFREADANDNYHKSIWNTKYVWQGAYHLPGACNLDGRNWNLPVSWDDGSFATENSVAILHFVNAYGERLTGRAQHAEVQNEA